MSCIIAIGPYSEYHGEARIFKHSCSLIQTSHDLIIIDSTRYKNRLLRPIMVIIRLLLVSLFTRFDYIYLSFSRKKIILLVFLPILNLLKKIKKFSVVYHIHDTSLKQNLTGPFASYLKKLYESTIDLTIIPNQHLEKYIRLSNKSEIRFLLNPYLGDTYTATATSKLFFHFISFPSYNKNLLKAIELVNQLEHRLHVVGWTKLDFYRLYPESDISLKNIKFLGVVSNKEVIKELQSSKGLISVSDSEAMPLNVIEALLSKVPVFVGKSSGYSYFTENFSTVLSVSKPCVLDTEFKETELTDSRNKARQLFDKKQYEHNLLQVFSGAGDDTCVN